MCKKQIYVNHRWVVESNISSKNNDCVCVIFYFIYDMHMESYK